jgi:hypothetical protein
MRNAIITILLTLELKEEIDEEQVILYNYNLMILKIGFRSIKVFLYFFKLI